MLEKEMNMEDGLSSKPIFSIEEFTDKLRRVRDMGWVPNHRPRNPGGAGNTLEDLLDVKENNFRAPDYGEYELKTHRKGSGYITLFHQEPTNVDYVKKLLLSYGWQHKSLDERRISITVSGKIFNGRGFRVVVDRQRRQVYVDFDIDKVKPLPVYNDWLTQIRNLGKTGQVATPTLPGLDILTATTPTEVIEWEGPIWTFDKLEEILYHKIYNMVVVQTETKKVPGGDFQWKYNSAKIYRKIDLNTFLEYIEQGHIYVDVDARTKKNHGVKFRVKPHLLLPLYETEEILM